MNVAMATVLLRHPIFIKGWSYHRNDSIATKCIHFEGIISHLHNRNVFLLIYLNYDVVLSQRVFHHINETLNDVMTF